MKDSALPPTTKGRGFEIYALGLREFAGLSGPSQRLDPFLLAGYANLIVAAFEDVEPLLSQETKRQLLGAGRNAWSGGACSQPLPDGSRLIILNPTHSRNRQNATLMEEICHVFLGHKPSRLAIREASGNGGVRARDYDSLIEEQAYAVGAASLVPFEGLKGAVFEGKTSRQIARHFRVSYQLVEYRLKVCRLWAEYLTVQGDGIKGSKALV